MPLRKDNSRNSDRNRIRRMHQQGYSIDQIADAVSITQEHIRYVLERYEDDLNSRRAMTATAQQEQAQIERIKNEEPKSIKQPLNAPEIKAIKDSLRAEIMAELKAEIMVNEKAGAAPAPEVEDDGQVPLVLDDEPLPEPEAEEKPKRTRRKRVAA